MERNAGFADIVYKLTVMKTSRLYEYGLLSALALLALYYGQTLFIPLSYGLFVAIVLFPLCRWLEQKGWPRPLAITAGLSIVMILFALLLWLAELQVTALRKDLPDLKLKITPALATLQAWITDNFGISSGKQDSWWQQNLDKLSDNSGNLISLTINKTLSTFFMLFLVPVFAALFLYNREDFAAFVVKAAGDQHRDRTRLILHKTIDTYYRFIRGMLLVYLLVGILNSIGLLALGIRHAILFGFLTAIMTIIPYVGLIISALLPITVAWITHDSIWYPIGVVAVFSFVQYLEANVIFPRVVAAQLNVSTWATLVALLAGGILWGISGMILFIPMVGIAKIVTDHLPEWEAANLLLRRKDKKK